KECRSIGPWYYVRLVPWGRILSAVPSSTAICLLSRPRTTRANTSRCRGVKGVKALLQIRDLFGLAPGPSGSSDGLINRLSRAKVRAGEEAQSLAGVPGKRSAQ